MKAVILAAGKGTRLAPFTFTRPKVMIPVANKPILEHNIEQLSGLVDEVIIITGYLEDMIKEHFGSSFLGMKIKYVKQEEQLGTGHAVLMAEGFLKGRFIVMYGDDLYHHDDIKKCLEHRFSVLAKKVLDPSRFGIFELEGDKVRGLVEKPEKPRFNLANSGMYVLDDSVFSVLKKIGKSKRGEYELTDAVLELSKTEEVFCEIVSKYWIPVGYPFDILAANEVKVVEAFSGEKCDFIDKDAVVEDGAILNGDVRVGRGTIIKSGTHIDGPCIIGENSTIGPHAYIRGGTVVGDNCHIGASVELKNTLVMNNSNVPHLSYAGDSVIGEHVNLGAGTVCANLRHDGEDVRMMCNKGVRVDTGRRKVGAFVADYTKTGINAVLYPGVMLGPFSWTGPAENVKVNVRPFEMLMDGKVKKLSADKFGNALKSDEERKMMKKLYVSVKVGY